jgi:hypothetical protein
MVARHRLSAPVAAEARRQGWAKSRSGGLLLDYWDYRIDTEQLRRQLKPIV